MSYLFERTQQILNELNLHAHATVADLFNCNLNLVSNEDVAYFRCGPFCVQKGDFVNTKAQGKLKYCLGLLLFLS